MELFASEIALLIRISSTTLNLKKSCNSSLAEKYTDDGINGVNGMYNKKESCIKF